MKASIENASGGFNRGKPLVISKPTDIKEFGFSPQQMNTEALRRVPEERVSAVVGIPAIVLGFGVGLEHATYANYRTAQRAGYDNCVFGTQKQIVAVLEQSLLPEFEANTDAYDVQFDNSEVDALKENENDKTGRETSMWINGIKKRSEVRSQFDLDTGPDDEVFYVEPGQTAPAAGQPSIPGPLGQQTGATLRGPHLPTIVPATEKGFGDIASPFNEISAWWNETAPEEARGLLDAEQVV
jgi:phage portal protein BeeE